MVCVNIKFPSGQIFVKFYIFFLMLAEEKKRTKKKNKEAPREGIETGEFSRVSMNKVTGKTNKFAARHRVSKVRAGQKVIRRLLPPPQIPG